MTRVLLQRARSWLPLAGVGVLALIVRVAYQVELSGSPLLSGLMGDSRQYDAWAQQIAGGQWVGTEVFYQTPLYPYWLAVVFKTAGHDLGLVRLIQAILGAVSSVLVGLAGRRFFGERVGVVAALLLALYPPAIFFDGLIQKSSLDIFLIALALALLAGLVCRPRNGLSHRGLARREERANRESVSDEQRRQPGCIGGRMQSHFGDGTPGTRREWTVLVALGVTIAVFTLNRENGRVLYPVVGAWLWFTFLDVSRRRRAAWIAVFAASSLAVLLPVALRNYHVGGELLISTSQLGPNFYIGNNPSASGTYDPIVPGHGDPVFERDDATRLASKAAGRALSPGEVSDHWLGQSFAYIRGQPIDWLRLVGKKTLLTLNAAELPDTESIDAYADYSWILRGLGWLNFGVMLPMAAFGAWVHRARWQRLLILYGMFAALALSVVIFYVVARYRHPVVPIVLLFSAAGVSAVVDILRVTRSADARVKRGAARRAAVRQKRSPPPAGYRPWLPGLGVAGLVAILAHLPFDVGRDETYLNLGALLAQNGRPADAIAVLSKAVSLDPEDAEPHFRLGLSYQDAGAAQAAIEELMTAVRLRPSHADAHGALGLLLRGQNRAADALAHFEEAVRHAPDSVEAHTNLGLSLMEAGRPAEAIIEHRRAIAVAPDTPNPHNNLAMALQQTGDVQQAIAEYRKALLIEPDDGAAHGNLGLALASVGDYEGALASLERALSIAKADGRADMVRRLEEAIRQISTLKERRAPRTR